MSTKNFADWLAAILDKQVELHATTPTYPARDAMPVERARERVASDFDALIREAEEWWQRHPSQEPDEDENPFERFALQDEEEEPPPVHAQRSPTGVGKTKIGAREISADRKRRQLIQDRSPLATRPWLYLGPTHRLNDSTAGQFRDADLTAKVYRGRLAPDPDVPGNEERPKSEQVLMCLAPERVKKAMALYQSISESCCENIKKNQVCEFLGECSFQEQLRGPTPDVWLAAHEMLFHDQKALAKLAGIIIDETFYQDGMSGIEEPREALTLDEIAIVGVDDPHLALHRERLVEILSKHPLGGLRRDRFFVETTMPDGRPAISVRMHEEHCTDAIRSEWKIFGRLKITPGMTEAEIDKLQEIIPDCVRARRMVGVWGALREMLASDDAAMREKLGLKEEIKVSGRLILVRKDGKIILRVRGVRPVLDARKVPTMLLDATLPSELILKKFHPQVRIVSDVEVAMPHVHVKQVVGAPVSQNKLFGSEKEPSKGQHLHAIRRYILKRWIEIDGERRWAEECQREPEPERRRKPMVVICQKEVRLWLENAPSERYEKVPRPGVTLPEGIALEHFNAIAGLDDHKDVRLLLSIGRTSPPPPAVEAIAGALTGAQPALEAPTGRGYGKVPRGIRMADGSGIEVERCDQHIDPVGEAVRYQICEAELIQAIGRGRGVNRAPETPLEVDILADVVLPVTVNEVVPWEEPSETVEMMASEGVALTSPTDMAKAWPWVWEKAEAARYTLRKLGERGNLPIEQAVKSLYSIFLIGKLPLATILYRRAVAGAHLAVAFFDPRHRPNPSAWLREKQGVLAESLHYLWRPGEIPPLAGEAGVVANAAVVKPEAKLPWSTPAVEEIFPTPEEVAAFWKLPPVIEGADPVADAKVPTSAPKVPPRNPIKHLTCLRCPQMK
jgi:putative DNA primase/helicase